MTISTTTSRVSYPGAGSAGPFAFPFRIASSADLLLTRRSALGVETTLALATDYTVAGVLEATGTVTLVTALAVGETLAIRRKPALTQATSIRNNGEYFASTHEDEFDVLVMQLQSLKDSIDRSIKLKESIAGGASLTELEPEAGKVVTGTGTGFTMTTLDSSAVSLPGESRTTATLSAYLVNNAVYNLLDYAGGVAIAAGVASASDAIDLWYSKIALGATGLIPIGRFRTTRKHSWNRQVNIVGLGVGSCLFPDLNSAVTDAIVVNDTVSATLAYVEIRDFAILSSAANACRDALVINRLNLSKVDVHVKVSAARYGMRFMGCLLSRFRVVSSVNYAYPYAAGSPAADTLRIPFDAVNSMGFNNNELDVKIEGGNNGVWIESQSNQGNNRITGCIEGTSGGTRGLYAQGCIGLNIEGLHCEGNAGAVELDTCSASEIGGGSQFIPNGNAGKLILTACSRIRLGAAYCDSVDVGATCSDIIRSPSFRTGAGGGVITDTANILRTEAGAITGTKVNAATGVAQTLLDASTRGQGSYEVRVSGTNLGSSYMAEATVICDGTNVAKVRGTDGANLTITVVGTSIKATQSSGGNATFGWTILFIPN